MSRFNGCGRRHRWAALAASSGAALLAAGCTVGPDFKPPTAWAPAGWSGGAAARSSASPAGSEPSHSVPVAAALQPDWWSAFGDPELTKLVTQAALANLDVRAATMRLAESRAQLRIAGADLYPQLNGDVSYTRERPSPKGIFGLFSGSGGGSGGASGGASGGVSGVPLRGIVLKPFNLYQYGVDASWQLDLWGKVRRSIENADATALASEEARRGTVLSTMAEVASDYIQLRGAQALLGIAEENVRTSTDDADLTKARAAAGLATQLDVANAEAQETGIQGSVPQYESQVTTLINQLSLLLGAPPGTLDAELRAVKPVPPVPPKVPIGLPSELARRRPDIRQAEAELHAETAEIGVAQANFYPDISLTGSFDLQAIKFRDLANWAARSYTIGPSLSLPIFEGGRLSGNLELAKASQQEAAIAYEKTVLNAWQEIASALTAYDKEQTRLSQLQESVAYDRTALTLSQDQYKRGLVSFLQVLTTEQNLLAEEEQAAQSQVNVSNDLVTLYKALGGGWETAGPPDGGAPPQQAASR